MDIQMFLIPQN